MFRASLEGVAFSFVYGANILRDMGMAIDVMRVGNDNMFQSEVFSTTIATLLGCHIEVMDTTGAAGAAKAAGVKIGLYKSYKEAVASVKPMEVYEPKLSHSLIDQAFSFWNSNLERALVEDRANSSSASGAKDVLSVKERELTNAEMRLLAKDDLLVDVKNELLRLGEGSSKVMKGSIAKLIDKLDKQLTNTRDWEAFEQHFELANSDLFKKLRQIIPNLSVDEARLCSLIKLNFSTKEIANNLNLSVRGVETKRYRLRKKLRLDAKSSLESWLQSI